MSRYSAFFENAIDLPIDEDGKPEIETQANQVYRLDDGIYVEAFTQTPITSAIAKQYLELNFALDDRADERTSVVMPASLLSCNTCLGLHDNEPWHAPAMHIELLTGSPNMPRAVELLDFQLN